MADITAPRVGGIVDTDRGSQDELYKKPRGKADTPPKPAPVADPELGSGEDDDEKRQLDEMA
jgi:hypothetical protein